MLLWPTWPLALDEDIFLALNYSALVMKKRDGSGWMLEKNSSNIPEFKMLQGELVEKSKQFSESNRVPKEFYVGAPSFSSWNGSELNTRNARKLIGINSTIK